MFPPGCCTGTSKVKSSSSCYKPVPLPVFHDLVNGITHQPVSQARKLEPNSSPSFSTSSLSPICVGSTSLITFKLVDFSLTLARCHHVLFEWLPQIQLVSLPLVLPPFDPHLQCNQSDLSKTQILILLFCFQPFNVSCFPRDRSNVCMTDPHACPSNFSIHALCCPNLECPSLFLPLHGMSKSYPAKSIFHVSFLVMVFLSPGSVGAPAIPWCFVVSLKQHCLAVLYLFMYLSSPLDFGSLKTEKILLFVSHDLPKSWTQNSASTNIE